MKDVDIIAQLRTWRDEFAKSHGYDIHAMAAALREMDCGNQKVVHGEPRRSVVAKMPNQTLQPTGTATSVAGSS
jgi:hypothetical protein